MIKFKFLAQFLVDQMYQLVVRSHILFLFFFAAFAYYVFGLFIAITT